jgi:chromate transport protein ChrA
MSFLAKILILAFVVFVFLALASVIRHALMIVPFVITGFYIYWKSGEKEEDEWESL